MAKTRRWTITGKIARVERYATSTNGNPTYEVALEDGRVYRTETDGQIGYGITNYRPHSMRETREVEITLHGKRERIIAVRYTDDTEA